MLWMITCPMTVVGWVLLALWIWKELSMGVCRSNKKLIGKTVIVTGGNAGIGFETAKDLARRGAKVVLACRSKERGMKAVEKIKLETLNKDVSLMILDLADFQSVKSFVKEAYATLEKVDILVNNAGIPPVPSTKFSKDNYDIVLQTNYFAPFYLVMQMRELMERSDEPRIINVSSLASRYLRAPIDYSSIKKGTAYEVSHVYGISKFMQCLFTSELARRWGDSGFLTYSLHPGAVRTEILSKAEVPPWFKKLNESVQFLLRSVAQMIGIIYGKSALQGAQTSIYCCVEDGLVNGEYYADCRLGWKHLRNKDISDPRMGCELWEFSRKLTEQL